jgi:xanthine dehydrogenase accessory factor
MSDWPGILDAIDRSAGPRVLVTLVEVDGSTPRDAGAKMLVDPAGIHGTIGGGRLEQDAIDLARGVLAGRDATPLVRTIALGPSLGQCCGGSVVVLVEPLGDLAWPGAVRACREARRACVVATVIDTACGDAGRKLVCDEVGPVAGGGSGMDAEVAAACAALLRASASAPRTIAAAGRTILLEPIPVEPPILVFGAGHVGRALVTVLGTLPRPVRWIDARLDAFPAALPANVLAETSDAPENEVDAAPPGAAYVVMTHSHALDLAIVERVLRRADFAYLGLIGSRTKRRRFDRRLALRGLVPDAVARLRCPIGLDGVGGKHPGEIAVAVAAELLAVPAAARAAQRSAR